MIRLFCTVVAAVLLVEQSVAEDHKLPQGVPPLVGTAVAKEGTGELWQIDLTVPKVRWEVVGEVIPNKQWPKLKVTVEPDNRMLVFGGPSALSESRVVDLSGKDVAPPEVLKRLKTSTAVLVSVSGEMADPYYLQLARPETLVIILGPRANSPAPELLPAAKGSSDPKANPRSKN